MERKPSAMNVLMVLADQHNAGQLGFAGHPEALTPNLDAFASEGMYFPQAYAQNPICTPARVSILSGQYCHNHGYYGLSGPAHYGLDNLFRHFRRSGYRTAGYGKLHLPESPRNWIADDVDEFGDTYETADGLFGKSAFLDGLESLGLRHLEDSWHNLSGAYSTQSISADAMASKLPYEHTQEAWCARKAMEFIDTGTDKPFFIQVALQRPHHPLLPQQRFLDMYPEDIELPPTWNLAPDHRPPHFQEEWKKQHSAAWEYGKPGESFEDGLRRAWRATLACVTQMDDIFGTLIEGLKERGLYENTIIIYSSDHGAYHGIHGLREKAPGICSDAVCRIPLIWRAPGATTAGSRSDALVEAVDFAATLPGLCGLPPMECVDGCDLFPLMAGTAAAVRQVAVTENVESRSIRWDRWRLVHYPRRIFPGQEVGELYDIEADPDERNNLYQKPESARLVQEGRRLLLDWLIGSLRVVTTHPASVLTGDKPHLNRTKSTYPQGSDGTATDAYQPRFAGGMNINYR